MPKNSFIVYKDNAGGEIFSDETYIATGLGGEGHRLRNYVVISTLNGNQFTKQQKEIVRKQFSRVSKKLDSKIEEIKFLLRKRLPAVLPQSYHQCVNLVGM